MLPQSFPQTGWFCAAGSSLASAQVGGDYFDLHPIGPDLWIAVVADVSGKGVSSALLASWLQGAFLMGSELEITPDELVGKLNRFLFDRAQREKYATLFYSSVHRSGQLAWVNAGHWPPILLRAGGQKSNLHSTGMPLGLLRKASFGCEQIQLADGDKIIAFSDGVTEAQNGQSEGFESTLLELARACSHLAVQDLHDVLVDAILKFRAGEPFRDDMTLLILEYKALPELMQVSASQS